MDNTKKTRPVSTPAAGSNKALATTSGLNPVSTNTVGRSSSGIGATSSLPHVIRQLELLPILDWHRLGGDHPFLNTLSHDHRKWLKVFLPKTGVARAKTPADGHFPNSDVGRQCPFPHCRERGTGRARASLSRRYHHLLHECRPQVCFYEDPRFELLTHVRTSYPCCSSGSFVDLSETEGYQAHAVHSPSYVEAKIFTYIYTLADVLIHSLKEANHRYSKGIHVHKLVVFVDHVQLLDHLKSKTDSKVLSQYLEILV